MFGYTLNLWNAFILFLLSEIISILLFFYFLFCGHKSVLCSSGEGVPVRACVCVSE